MAPIRRLLVRDIAAASREIAGIVVQMANPERGQDGCEWLFLGAVLCLVVHILGVCDNVEDIEETKVLL